MGKGGQLCGGAGGDHAAAGIKHRPLGLGQRLGHRPDLLDVSVQRGFVARQIHTDGRLVVHLPQLEGDGDIDDHRPGPACTRDVKGLVDDPRQVCLPGHQVRVFDDRQRDAGGVGLLEGIGADEVRADLAGDGDDWDRVQIGIRDAGDQVGGARAASGDAGADLAGGPRVAVGRVHGALFVAHEHVTQLLGVHQRVVERDDHAAGEAEENFAAFGFQRRDDGL